ncbi:MAG: hypothetical protein IJF71_01710 [Clostridia bacterium]|nr:hypothetical protein [Clostridia bacterium]
MKKGTKIFFYIINYLIPIATVAVFCILFAPKSGTNWVRSVICAVVGALFGYVFCTALHELCHLAVAKKTGCEILGFSLGMLHFRKTEGKFALSVHRTDDAAGSLTVLPPAQGTESALSRVLTAGIVGSSVGVFLLCLCTLLAVLTELSSAVYLAACALGVSLFLLVNLFVPDGRLRDGDLLHGLKANRADTQYFVCYAKAVRLLADGAAPDALNPTVTDSLPVVEDTNLYRASLFLLKYYHHLHTGDLAAANAVLTRMSSSLEDLSNANITAAIARSFALEELFMLCVSGNAAAQERAEALAPSPLSNDADELRVLAAYQKCILHDEEAYQQTLEKISALPRIRFSGLTAMNEEIAKSL